MAVPCVFSKNGIGEYGGRAEDVDWERMVNTTGASEPGCPMRLYMVPPAFYSPRYHRLPRPSISSVHQKLLHSISFLVLDVLQLHLWIGTLFLVNAACHAPINVMEGVVNMIELDLPYRSTGRLIVTMPDSTLMQKCPRAPI